MLTRNERLEVWIMEAPVTVSGNQFTTSAAYISGKAIVFLAGSKQEVTEIDSNTLQIVETPGDNEAVSLFYATYY